MTKGWSEAYGLFLDGEADMVLSYTTSPTYHQVAEDVHKYGAAIFEEGHVAQVEVAGILQRAPVGIMDVTPLARDQPVRFEALEDAVDVH